MRLPLQRLGEKLWWLDVIYPIALAALLFGSLTYVVYAGRPSARLSHEGDSKLLEYSLSLGMKRRPGETREVLVVSGDVQAIDSIGKSTGPLPDYSVESYAKVIERLAATGIRTIIVSWATEAHSGDVDFEPLERALRELPEGTEVVFIAASETQSGLSEEIVGRARVLSDTPCWYPDRIQALCSYNPSWKFWIAQYLVDRWSSGDPKTWTGESFASNYPSYVLNLADPASLSKMSFAQVLAGEEVPRGMRVAFVGADLAGAVSETMTARFVLTAYDHPGVDTMAAGTPIHVFWASVAQMFLDGAVPNLPSRALVHGVTIAFCVFVVLVMWRFGGPAALGMFVVYVLSGPYVNALALSHLNLYVPLFDSYYFGLATFVMAGFGRLSFTAFQRWRLDEQRRMHAHTADLKGNFVSLLSHNLNTPVAKMQGMLGLLASQQGDESFHRDIQEATALVAQLEYCIRSVLIATALEEGSLNPQARNVRAISADFADSSKASLQRLGLDITIAEPHSEEEDLLFVPLHFDQRALHAGVAALAGLFAREGRRTRLDVRFGVRAGDDGKDQLEIVVSSADAFVPTSALAILSSKEAGTVRSLTGQTFFTDVLAGLVVQLAKTYRGSLQATPTAPGGTVNLTLLSP